MERSEFGHTMNHLTINVHGISGCRTVEVSEYIFTDDASVTNIGRRVDVVAREIDPVACSRDLDDHVFCPI